MKGDLVMVLTENTLDGMNTYDVGRVVQATAKTVTLEPAPDIDPDSFVEEGTRYRVGSVRPYHPVLYKSLMAGLAEEQQCHAEFIACQKRTRKLFNASATAL